MNPRRIRAAAGAAALLLLLALIVQLAPHYWRNLQFQRTLDAIGREAVAAGRDDEAVRVAVVNAAARQGLPVVFDRVALRRSEGRLEIQVRYDTPVELPVIGVSLHFRPRVRVP